MFKKSPNFKQLSEVALDRKPSKLDDPTFSFRWSIWSSDCTPSFLCTSLHAGHRDGGWLYWRLAITGELLLKRSFVVHLPSETGLTDRRVFQFRPIAHLDDALMNLNVALTNLLCIEIFLDLTSLDYWDVWVETFDWKEQRCFDFKHLQVSRLLVGTSNKKRESRESSIGKFQLEKVQLESFKV